MVVRKALQLRPQHRHAQVRGFPHSLGSTHHHNQGKWVRGGSLSTGSTIGHPDWWAWVVWTLTPSWLSPCPSPPEGGEHNDFKRCKLLLWHEPILRLRRMCIHSTLNTPNITSLTPPVCICRLLYSGTGRSPKRWEQDICVAAASPETFILLVSRPSPPRSAHICPDSLLLPLHT